MKELELLTILTNVRGEYILEAQQLRSGQRKQLRLMHRKRIFLIAAVISLLLLLVGCAAVLIGLQKVSLGHMEFSDSWGEAFERDVLSLNGYTDSPEYRATLEWMEFENSYDQDKALLRQANADHYMAPPDYDTYLCYTDEMCKKIDEICRKYGLELAGPTYVPSHPEQALEAVAVSSIENENSDRKLLLDEGRYYRSGSFLLGGTLQNRLADDIDWNAMRFSYTCDKKNVFTTHYITTDDLNSFDVWEYTAWDGTRLLLAQNMERGLIYTDTEEYFTSVVLYFTVGEDTAVGSPGQRVAMERIADTFVYAIQPRKPEAQWLQNTNPTVANAPLKTEIPELTGAQAPTDPAVLRNPGDSIDFRYLYRGFSTISLDDMAAFEAFSGFGTKLILNEEDRSTFMGSYCPGIPYYDTCDFSKECLIASVIQGARPTYANSNTITRLSWGEGHFVFEYENNPANYIYALNGDNGTHFYVGVIIISRADLPDDVEDFVYRPLD